jgi:hypothetical protein
MTASSGECRCIAYCDCGERLAGGSERELFDAAQRHITDHHPHLLAGRRASSIVSLQPNWDSGPAGAAQLGGAEPSAGS